MNSPANFGKHHDPQKLVFHMHCLPGMRSSFQELQGIMPNGQAHLMVNLAEDEFKTYPAPRSEHICKHSGAVVAGPHAKSVVIDTRRRWRCRSAGKSCACW